VPISAIILMISQEFAGAVDRWLESPASQSISALR